MAGSVNKVILIGNLGADPEIRTTQDSKEIGNLRIATSESWKDKSTGERKEKTEWHRVVVYSPGLINIIKSYAKKGSKLYIEGALQTRKWQDKEGKDIYTTEVVLQAFNSTITLLDSKKEGNSGGGDYGYNNAESQDSNYSPSINNAQKSAVSANNYVTEELDDSIPF